MTNKRKCLVRFLFLLFDCDKWRAFFFKRRAPEKKAEHFFGKKARHLANCGVFTRPNFGRVGDAVVWDLAWREEANRKVK